MSVPPSAIQCMFHAGIYMPSSAVNRAWCAWGVWGVWVGAQILKFGALGLMVTVGIAWLWLRAGSEPVSYVTL